MKTTLATHLPPHLAQTQYFHERLQQSAVDRKHSVSLLLLTQLELVLVRGVPLSLGVGAVPVFLDPKAINDLASLKPQAPPYKYKINATVVG